MEFPKNQERLLSTQTKTYPSYKDPKFRTGPPICRNSHVVPIRINSKPALRQPQAPLKKPEPLLKDPQFKPHLRDTMYRNSHVRVRISAPRLHHLQVTRQLLRRGGGLPVCSHEYRDPSPGKPVASNSGPLCLNCKLLFAFWVTWLSRYILRAYTDYALRPSKMPTNKDCKVSLIDVHYGGRRGPQFTKPSHLVDVGVALSLAQCLPQPSFLS